MKNKLNLLIVFIITMALLVSCSTTTIEETATPSHTPIVSDVGYGAVGSFNNDNISIEQMLTYAIQDEYLAKSEYEYIINEMNGTKPFTNIIKAEQTHIELLVPLFETYGFTLPEDTSKEHLVVPSSLTEAYKTGVKAEIDNIAMYDQFLTLDLPDDIRTAFITLRDASKNHLAAFERQLER